MTTTSKALKDELIYAKKLAMDEEESCLVWTGNIDRDHRNTCSASPVDPSSLLTQEHTLCRTSISVY